MRDQSSLSVSLLAGVVVLAFGLFALWMLSFP
jgi:hypothetical protein